MTPTIITLMSIVLLFPAVMLPLVIVVAVLTAQIPVSGVWRDSFDLQTLSVSRIFQSIAALAVAGTTLIGLATSGATAFPPIPGWLLALAGGGNAVYLGTKWISSRNQDV